LSAPWVCGIMDYDPFNTDNTNTLMLVTRAYSAFAAYIKAAAIYKCPDDRSSVTIHGTQLPRARSYCLNGWLGGNFSEVNSTLPPLVRARSQIGVMPGRGGGFTQTGNVPSPPVPPSEQFCFLDAHPDTIWSSQFIMAYTYGDPGWLYGFDTLPAYYHDKSGTISFADGHVEAHRWTTSTFLSPITGQARTSVPTASVPQSGYWADLNWIFRHTVFFTW
jgi:prepilin-type processing-associated H-X9-DG protein